MAKRVLVKVVKKGNSIIVTCHAPQSIMDALLMKAELNLKELQKLGLIKLTLGYYIVWDGCIQNTIMSAHSDHDSSPSYPYDSPIEVEESHNTSKGVQDRSILGPSAGIYAGVTQVGQVLGIMPIKVMYQPSIQASTITHDSAFIEGIFVFISVNYFSVCYHSMLNTIIISVVKLSFPF